MTPEELSESRKRLAKDELFHNSLQPTLSNLTWLHAEAERLGETMASAERRNRRTSIAPPEEARAFITSLPGEQLCLCLPAFFESHLGSTHAGRLVITSYQLCFLPESLVTGEGDEGTAPAASGVQRQVSLRDLGYTLSFFHVPVSSIARIEAVRRGRGRGRRGRPAPSSSSGGGGAGSESYLLHVTCKDVRALTIGFREVDSQAHSRRVIELVHELAFPRQASHLFAFAHGKSVPGAMPPPVFTEAGELRRQRILVDDQGTVTKPWRATTANFRYDLCPSYPKLLIVPHAISDYQLKECAAFRTRGRIPILCWRHPRYSTTLWRSSQPRVGVGLDGGNRSPSDEAVLREIHSATPGEASLLIADCRPQANAMANRAAGAGYENSSNYPFADLEFLNIGNIHVMRDSVRKLASLCQSPNPHDLHWLSAVEDTQWLVHIRRVLFAARMAADAVHRRGRSVLVHCSDGWDRTSQVSSLAMLLLDQYYRTLEGFCVLIAREWAAAGHRFATRLGHGSAKGEDHRSPIFIQFLDCVWQLMNLYPQAFSFTPEALVCVAHHTFSCRFGDFLFDCDRERGAAGVGKSTRSLLHYLLSRADEWANPLFIPQAPPVLLPPPVTLSRSVTLWGEYWLRFAPAPAYPRVHLRAKRSHEDKRVFAPRAAEGHRPRAPPRVAAAAAAAAPGERSAQLGVQLPSSQPSNRLGGRRRRPSHADAYSSLSAACLGTAQRVPSDDLVGSASEPTCSVTRVWRQGLRAALANQAALSAAAATQTSARSGPGAAAVTQRETSLRKALHAATARIRAAETAAAKQAAAAAAREEVLKARVQELEERLQSQGGAGGGGEEEWDAPAPGGEAEEEERAEEGAVAPADTGGEEDEEEGLGMDDAEFDALLASEGGPDVEEGEEGEELSPDDITQLLEVVEAVAGGPLGEGVPPSSRAGGAGETSVYEGEEDEDEDDEDDEVLGDALLPSELEAAAEGDAREDEVEDDLEDTV